MPGGSRAIADTENDRTKSCFGGGWGGTTPMGTPAGTYTVTVTATAGTQKATTIVSVTVQ